MTLTRAALYIGVATALGVWLSSAASSMPQENRHAPVVEGAPETSGLAIDVQEQSRRLKQRLAAGSPAPRPMRNPFEFRTDRPAARPTGDNRAPEPPPFEPFQPAPADDELSLIGVATHERPDGPIHTAVIATVDGGLIMAVAGDTVLGRFSVTAVRADSVDLLDPATGASVRLRLEIN